MVTPRTVAHHEADARRVVKGRDPAWLRGYIARHAMRMMIADEELIRQRRENMLSKGLAEALKTLRFYAGAVTGRQRPVLPDLEEA